MACPDCGVQQARVHAYHERFVGDVAVDAGRVLVVVRVRRLVCATDGCRRTFREQVPGMLERHQRRTNRLAGQIGVVATELARRAGARVLTPMAMSRQTAIRSLRRLPDSRVCAHGCCHRSGPREIAMSPRGLQATVSGVNLIGRVLADVRVWTWRLGDEDELTVDAYRFWLCFSDGFEQVVAGGNGSLALIPAAEFSADDLREKLDGDAADADIRWLSVVHMLFSDLPVVAFETVEQAG